MAPQVPHNSKYFDDDAEAGGSLDLRNLYFNLIERAWVILLCLAAAVFLTLGYVKRCPVIYRATAVLQVEQEQSKFIVGTEFQRENLTTPETLKTLEKLLESRALLERVIITNGLAQDARFVSRTGTPPTIDALVSRLAGMVDVKLQQGTRLLNVSVEHTDPALAERIANSLVRTFMVQNYEQQSAFSEVAVEFLVEQANQLKKKLQSSQKALQNFREAKQSVSLDEPQNIVVQKLKELSTQVSDAERERIRLDSESQRVEQLKGDVPALTAIKTIADDTTVAAAKVSLAQQEIDFANIQQRYKARHVRYIEAKNKLAEWQLALTNAVLKAVQKVGNTHEAARQTETNLRKLLKEHEQRVIELNTVKAQYDELVKEIKSDQELYDALVKRIKETSIGKGWEENKVRVVQKAYLPEAPIKPNKQLLFAIGIVAGLGIGVLLALGLSVLDSSFKTAEQAEHFLNLAILTTIPSMRSLKSGKSRIIMSHKSEYLGTETFRTLRTTLSLLGPEETRRTFLFTSAVPEEGKTFCAMNFAGSLAQQGRRTLLIECDLRAPALEAALAVDNPGVAGVADYLLGQQKFSEVVYSTEMENLSYIPAGSRVSNPSELLAHDAVAALIKEALAHFDRVVIDSAPIQPVSDTLLLVHRVQTVCMVVRANKTPRKIIQRAVQILQKAKAPLAGIVVNRLSQARRDPYYDYSYYSAYAESPAKKA
jgi:polysaccharide biosynthesis transport protein